MPRSTGPIQAEITLIEGQLSGSTGNAGGLASQMSAGATSISFADRQKLEQRLEFLYRQMDRITNGGMINRGRVVGLAGGPVSTNSP